MKVYKNTKFIKRDYECSNIVACVTDKAPGTNWIEADESLITCLQPLYTENEVKYYGYL